MLCAKIFRFSPILIYINHCVDIIISMFISISLASIITSILFEATKRLGGQAVADFLSKRIKKKLHKEHAINPEKEGATEEEMEIFRQILQDELQSLGMKEKEIDLLLLKSVQSLADDHQEILSRMKNVENLLAELTTGLLYESVIHGTDVPLDLSEKLFERHLKGEKNATDKLSEYIDEGHYSSQLENSLESYEVFRQAYQEEDRLANRFLNHFKQNQTEINQLVLMADIWAIIGAENVEKNKVFAKIISSFLNKQDQAKNLELDELLKFLHLLDLTGSINKIDTKFQSTLIYYLVKEIELVPFYTQIEVSYYLSKLGYTDNKISSIVENAFKELNSQNYSDRFVQESVSISKRVLRFFSIKKSSVDITKSTKILQSLTRRLQRRKFERMTSLLEGQLTRTLAETNLIAMYFDHKNNHCSISDLSSLKKTVQSLMSILAKTSSKDTLNTDIRLKIWKIIDNCVFILNRVVVSNTSTMFNKWELDLAKHQGLFSENWGEYRRLSQEQMPEVLGQITLTEKMVKKIELEKTLSQIDELPEPPKTSRKYKEFEEI